VTRAIVEGQVEWLCAWRRGQARGDRAILEADCVRWKSTEIREVRQRRYAGSLLPMVVVVIGQALTGWLQRAPASLGKDEGSPSYFQLASINILRALDCVTNQTNCARYIVLY
jgi:hypothetical protein